MKSLLVILRNPRYFGPAWAFASLNILFGTWAIYIPIIQEKLAISKSDLGIAIFCLALGTFASLSISAKIITKIGVGKATGIGVFLICAFSVFPLLAPSYYWLMVALFIQGATQGFLDIAMNTLVTDIEKQDKQNFMSAAHGFFSLGGVLAGLGSFLIIPLANPALHMVLAMILVLTVSLCFVKHYWHIKAPIAAKEPFSFKHIKPLFLLAVISFVIMGSEGAIVDWSGLFLKEVSIAPEHLWGFGFLAFSITMTLGRFLADGISAKIGSVKIVVWSISIALVGFLLVLTTGTFAAILGFAFVGLGFSVIIPELFRIGGNVEGVESSQGISFIAGTGYSGFLIGPVVLGFVADSFGLSTSFVVLTALSALVLLAAIKLLNQK